MFQQTKNDVRFKVKVVPKSAHNAIIGWENGELKIRLAAVPEKGEANAALLRFLSEVLDLSQSSLSIVYGETSRHKCVSVAGLTVEQIKERLL